MQRPLQEARLHLQNNWYTDLNSLVKDAQATPAVWEFGDARTPRSRPRR